jgi:hypothetical protein
MISQPKRFEAAIRRFDEANGEDPNRECSSWRTLASGKGLQKWLPLAPGDGWG